MIVTPFGDQHYGNHSMERQWLAAHEIRHRAYAQAMARGGVGIAPSPLVGKVDDEWVRVHYHAHMVLLRSIPSVSSVSTQLISMNPMSSEVVFDHWHVIHNLLHTMTDQALGVLP